MIIGENKESTIIDGGGDGDVIILMGANNNTVKEITIQNGKPDPVVFPPVSGYTRVFLKENYSFTANAIDTRASPKQAWITLRKNDTIIDDLIIEEGTLFKEDRSGLILSLKVDKFFAGSSSEYILFSNVTQYSDTNHNIIVQNETAMLKVGEVDDFVPLKGGIEWGLDENYALSILDVDITAFPRQTMLLLSKNGAPVEFKIIKTGDMYTFNKSGRLILNADIEAIFGGPGVYLAKLSHVYQYSESTPDLLLNDGSHKYIVGNPRTVKWKLLQNYSLTAMDIDSRSLPRLIWFELSKDSVVIEDKILQSGNDYSFYNDSSKILSLNVGEIFDGRKSDLAFVSNVYQYSEVGTVLKQNETHIFQLSSSSGIDWPLFENYTISFMDVDINIFPAQAWMQMKKNGDIVDDRLVTVNQTYSYMNPSGRDIFNGKIDTIFSGNLNLLKVKNADQYSEVDGTPLILNTTRSFYPINLEYVESLSEKFQLYENYSITPIDISARTSPRRVWIRLYQNGTLVDEKILDAPVNSLDFQNYSYYSGGRMIISTKPGAIFSGATSDLMQFKDFYQYSEIDGAPLMYIQKKTLSVGARLSINNVGMTLDRSNWNNLQDLSVLNNFYGISMLDSRNNMIYNNIFNNTNNFHLSGTNTNTWNTTKQSGTNIIGGSYFGGNFWANPGGTGFSQTCSDSNKDGICDTNYILGNIDYLPLAAIPSGYGFISGFVLNSSLGISNSFVTTNSSNTTNTDPSGFYSLFVPTGTYNLTVTKNPDYYSNTSVIVTAISGTTIPQDIELFKKPTGNITGSVTKAIEPELIINGGFETGDFTNWSIANASITNENAHSGVYSLKMKSQNGEESYASQDFSQPTIANKVTFWLRCANGDLCYGGLSIDYPCEPLQIPGSCSSGGGGGIIVPNEWTKFEQPMSINQKIKSVKITVISSGSEFLLDDISVKGTE